MWYCHPETRLLPSTLPGSPASVCKAHCSLTRRPRPSSEPGPSGRKCWRRCQGRDREASHLNTEHGLSLGQKLSGHFMEILGNGSLKRNKITQNWKAPPPLEISHFFMNPLSLGLSLDLPASSCFIFIGMHWELGPQGLGLQALIPWGFLVTIKITFEIIPYYLNIPSINKVYAPAFLHL